MTQVICLSESTWRSHPGRTQALLSHLPQIDCLYFEPPVTFLAFFLGRTGRRRVRAHRSPGKMFRPGITVYALPPILPFGRTYRFIQRYNRRKLARYIRKKMEQHAFRLPLFWCATELGAGLPALLPYSHVLYDCRNATPGIPLRDVEQALLKDADLVFAPTATLAQFLSFAHSNVALVENGISAALFAPAPENENGADGRYTPSPAYPAPILGCTEPISAKTDLTLLCSAIRENPSWSFLFLGSVAPQAAEVLEPFPNVHMPNPKTQSARAALIRQFDLCISLQPPRLPPRTARGPHLLEYLATGRPIVACDPSAYEPALQNGVIYIASRPENISAVCAAAMEASDPQLAARRQAYAQAADWTVQAEKVVKLLEINGVL